MKKYLGIVIAVFALLVLSFIPAYSIEQVVTALRKGDAESLAKYFDSRIDISLPDKSDNYSKKQAEMILKDFFTNNGVKSFEVKHKGENNGAEFCIGSLQTRNGTFRVKLYMKQKGDQQVIQEISFQKEE